MSSSSDFIGFSFGGMFALHIIHGRGRRQEVSRRLSRPGPAAVAHRRKKSGRRLASIVLAADPPLQNSDETKGGQHDSGIGY
ncbi:hypothetical protein [Rhizobium glycinendophyticum]|uniref:Uncharacterized protein n=1 Tax=Rhizobium glycinendophyticum TaxID=2589807 RepID=A0A504U908_9HYPH|nr:hypothetical protein [Rhizobium glycinendophyticum]TPP11698.1 hypothetical protein FJQ55_13140 [Rhizobium glycinendophyticum]